MSLRALIIRVFEGTERMTAEEVKQATGTAAGLQYVKQICYELRGEGHLVPVSWEPPKHRGQHAPVWARVRSGIVAAPKPVSKTRAEITAKYYATHKLQYKLKHRSKRLQIPWLPGLPISAGG